MGKLCFDRRSNSGKFPSKRPTAASASTQAGLARWGAVGTCPPAAGRVVPARGRNGSSKYALLLNQSPLVEAGAA